MSFANVDLGFARERNLAGGLSFGPGVQFANVRLNDDVILVSWVSAGAVADKFRVTVGTTEGGTDIESSAILNASTVNRTLGNWTSGTVAAQEQYFIRLYYRYGSGVWEYVSTTLEGDLSAAAIISATVADTDITVQWRAFGPDAESFIIAISDSANNTLASSGTIAGSTIVPGETITQTFRNVPITSRMTVRLFYRYGTATTYEVVSMDITANVGGALNGNWNDALNWNDAENWVD